MRRVDRRLVLGFVAIAGLPIVLLVDLLIAALQGWWTTSSVWIAIVVICTALVAAAVLAVATARGRRLLQRKWAAIALATVTAICAGFGAEVVVAWTLDGRLHFHRSAPGTVRVFSPRSDIMPGVHGESRYTANSLGIRGPEFPAQRVRKQMSDEATDEPLFLL